MKIQIPPVGMRHGLFTALRALFPIKTKKQILHEKNNAYNEWYFINSGKSALLFILKILKQQSHVRNEVIIPAYTCYSVAAAISESGLKIKLCDIDPKTLDYNYNDLDALICDKTLCVIRTRLFDISSNDTHINDLLKKKDVYVIEDAAQCEPIDDNKQYYRDVTIYSLGRGKPLSAMGGGILICLNHDLNKYINESYQALPNSSLVTELKKFLEVLINDIFLNPYLFWIPYSIKYLNLGKTIYPHNIEIKKLSMFQLRLYFLQLRKLQFYSKLRKNAVRYYREILPRYYDEQYVKSNMAPARFPYYMQRDVAELTDDENLKLSCLGVTRMYPQPINQLKEIKDCLVNGDMEFKGSDWVVKHLLTLPTHEYVNADVQEKIVSTLLELDSK